MPKKQHIRPPRHCVCKLCRHSRRVQLIMANGSHQQKNRLINELMEHLHNVESDLEYHEVIMDGSWPQAVEILERSLVKAKQIKAEREEKRA